MVYQLYALVFPNGKIYIGITAKTYMERWQGHCATINKRLAYPLYSAIKKYGAANVTPVLLAVGEQAYIQDAEVRAIISYKTLDRKFGYNLAPGGTISPMHSPEIAAKVRASRKLRMETDPEFAAKNNGKHLQSKESREKSLATIRSPECRAAKSKTMKGMKRTPEQVAAQRLRQSDPIYREKQRERVSLAWSDPALRKAQGDRSRGRVITEEQRQKISAALMGHPGAGKGKKRDPALVAAFSAARMGHIVTEETRMKISLAHKGKKASDETRAKLSEARRGKKLPPHSEETKQKIRESLTGRVQSEETKNKRNASIAEYRRKKAAGET